MVEGEQNPVGHEVAPPKDAPHSRQQKSSKEQVLPEERDEDQLHDDHREPAPVSAEELLATGFQKQGEVMVCGTSDVVAEELPDAEEKNEGDHPQPHPSTHAPAPRIAGREQPEGVAHPRPAKGALLAPGEDQGQNELPDEPRCEAKQQGLNECFIAPA
jgi:hypothetical protein